MKKLTLFLSLFLAAALQAAVKIPASNIDGLDQLISTAKSEATAASLFGSRVAKAGAYTVVAPDRGKVFDATTGTWTLTLTEAATLGSGFSFGVFNSGSGTITIDPAGSESIRDASGSGSSKALAQGEGGIVMCDGTGFLFLKVTNGSISNAPYDVDAWNDVASVAPSQGAVRNQLQAMLGIINGKAALRSVSALSSNALALGAAPFNVKEATWSSATSNRTFTFGSGHTTAGNGIALLMRFTDTTTVLFPSAYRNGAGSPVSTYTYPAGLYRVLITVRADGSSIDWNDDYGTASDLPFTPGGNVSASNVQAAIAELDTEKLDSGVLNNTAFGSGWGTDTTHAPTKKTVFDQLRLIDADDDGKVEKVDVTGPGVVLVDSSGNVSAGSEAMVIACSDETTTLTTGTAVRTFRMPFACTITGVRASVNTVSSSGLPTVDINEEGVSIMTTTKLTIDASEKSSATAATPAVLTDTAIADNAEMTIDIDAAGTGAKGLKVTIFFKR